MKKMFRVIISFILVLAILSTSGRAPFASEVNAASTATSRLICSTADDWTDLFSRTGVSDTWLGADGIFTVSLDENDSLGSATSSTETFFIFSDTILGDADSSGNITNKVFQNHTSAILTGNTPTNANMSFKYGDKANMSTDAWSNLFGYKAWMQDSVTVGSDIYVLGIPFDPDWKPNQVDLIKIPIVNDSPDYANFTKTSAISQLYLRNTSYMYCFGVGIMSNTTQANAMSPDGYIYMYGYRDDLNTNQKDMVVSRVLRSELPSLSNTKYWDGSTWSSTLTDSAVVLSDVSCELSVTPITTGIYSGKYMAIYQKNVNSVDLMYAIGDSPVGPFATPVKFYTVPDQNGELYTYNAKAHPHLSEPGQLLISYNVNKLVPVTNTADYHPYFVNLDLATTSTLPVTNGLVMNLDASAITGLNSGDQVSTWNDLSASNNNATQTTSSMEPTYQTSPNKAVRFDGGDQLNFDNINAQSVFIVSNVATGSTVNDGIIGWNGQDKGIRRFWDTGWNDSTYTDANDFTNPTGSVFRVNKVATGDAAEGAWHLMTAIRSGSTETMNVLGQYYTNRGIEADISEVVVYNRELTSAEMTSVENYLLNKWMDIPSLPVTNGLVMNLDASAITGLNSGDQVSTWNDLSASNNNATQTTSSMEPTYQTSPKKAVRFDGGDQLNFDNINAQSVFIVSNVATGSTVNDGIIGWNGQDKGIRRFWDTGWNDSTYTDANDFTNPTGSIFRVNKVATGDAAEGAWHLMTAIRSGSTETMNVLGQYYTNRGIEADISEVLIYKRALSPAEMTLVENYLYSKWIE